MFSIYKSLSPRVPLEDTCLFENVKYYLVFESPNSSELNEVIEKSEIKEHISWHPGNRIAELRITNRIGLLRIFDRQFDVRSNKFCDSMSGTQQIEKIISELNDLSKSISFAYDSSLYNKSDSDWESIQSNQIHKLNYLHQIFFEIDHFNQAGFQLEKIKRNPALKHSISHSKKPLWKIKKITPNTLRRLVKTGFSNASKSTCHSIVAEDQVLSNNTNENQFIKFFFEHAQQVALDVLSNKTNTDTINRKATSLIKETRHLLFDPFFQTVENSTKIQTNSTVLFSRDGYAQIFKYFTNSFFSVEHIFEDYKSELKVDLIDIATLYEIWCFYKLSFHILGSEILITQKSSVVKDGAIRNSTCFENDMYKISYNHTYSISSQSSYSTTLRPDISVRNKTTSNLFHFDAKYRINSYIGDDELQQKTFKNDDINKMHSYLDAIYGSKSAIILYPGTNFKFFVRQEPCQIHTGLSGDFKLEGVGAIPFVPGLDNLVLAQFTDKYFP